MSEAQHTPGEWASEYCGKDTIKVFKMSDKRRIATIKVKSITMDEANAKLIAAAPEILAALKSYLRAPSIGSDGPGSSTIVIQEFYRRAAIAAIAKAS